MYCFHIYVMGRQHGMAKEIKMWDFILRVGFYQRSYLSMFSGKVGEA